MATEPTGPTDPKEPNGQGDPSKQQADPKAEPPAIDYDKIAEILDGRQKATEDSVLKGYFKQQGITGDEAAQAIKAFKDAKAAKAPDVDGLNARIGELERTLSAAKVENAVTQAAVQMGIDAKVIPYLTRMADLSDVGDAGGGIDAEKVTTALKKVLDDVPGLKPQALEGSGFSVGGTGDKGAKAPKADDAQLRRAFGLKK